LERDSFGFEDDLLLRSKAGDVIVLKNGVASVDHIIFLYQLKVGHDGLCGENMIAIGAGNECIAPAQHRVERMEPRELQVLIGAVRGLPLREGHEFGVTLQDERRISPNIFPAKPIAMLGIRW